MDYEYDYYDYPDRVDLTAHEPILTIASILGQAYFQCALSGLRFGFTATKSIVRGHIRLIDNLQASRNPEQSREETIRTLVDEARGCLRDLGEAASCEVRRLQSKLGTLQEVARQVIVEGNHPDSMYIRRWKAKS